jgi:two-component system alkaline phosphatase synthesis response regulator PhoP
MSKQIKVLVAEDEQDIRNLIAFSLEYIGYKVVQASNGEEAVEKAAKELPHLIMLDVRMPRLNGYEACKKLKSQASTKDIPVVFLSARGQETEIKHGLELGAEEYILKPFAPDELQQRVTSILARLQQDKDVK